MVRSLLPVLVAAGAAILAIGAPDDSVPSTVLAVESMSLSRSDTAEMRTIMKGKLATGERVEVPETTLPPNASPHPPHHHVHSEMWLIREGSAELTINGIRRQLGPGDLDFVHLNEEHGIKNVGTGPATYFVVAVGPGADA